MWMAPPSGLRLTNAATTPSVSLVTSSRTRAEAAPWPPLMARNALVIAMVILDGSKDTTEPLRRMTLYCEKRGSDPLPSGLPGSPTIRSRGGAEAGLAEGVLAMCMCWFSCTFLVVAAYSVADSRRAGVYPKGPSGAGFRGLASMPPAALPVAWGLSGKVHRNPLVNQNLLYLVFMWRLNTKHSGSRQASQGLFCAPEGARKRQEKQPPAAIPAAYPRAVHRLSTALSTTSAADER